MNPNAFSKIAAANRAQLIDDAMNLARGKRRVFIVPKIRVFNEMQ